jgi:Zn ribbon nucleic-acid-binding protein
VKEWVTEHVEWCQHKDNSEVMWDQESNVTSCMDCGAITEQRDTEVETQMLPQEVPDGHPA